MRPHFPLLAGVAMVLIALSAGAAEPSPPNQERDGNWLRSGIREYERMQNKESQSSADLTLAVGTVFYIRGVLDVQSSLNTKASVQGMVIHTSEQLKNPKERLPQYEIDGMRSGNKFFVPLSQTEFFSAQSSVAQCAQFIKNYLEKHPENWNKHANEIIEAALLDAYQVAKQ